MTVQQLAELIKELEQLRDENAAKQSGHGKEARRFQKQIEKHRVDLVNAYAAMKQKP